MKGGSINGPSSLWQLSPTSHTGMIGIRRKGDRYELRKISKENKGSGSVEDNVRRNKRLEFFRERMIESKAEKVNRKRGKGLIDLKERKIGRVTTTQKNSVNLST